MIQNQFLKFAGVGAIATACHYVILIVLVEFFDFDAVFASTAGFVASSVLNYRLNYSFTFQSSRSHQSAFPRFCMTALVGLLINSGTMTLLVDFGAQHYLFSQLCATLAALFWNFLINRIWSFSDHPKDVIDGE